MKNKITVLLTAAGGAGTIYAIKRLCAHPKHQFRTITVDANPHAAGIYLADKGYAVPPISADYFEKLKDIIIKEKIDVVIPLIDEEILRIHDLAKELGVAVLAPKKEFAAMALDKLKVAQEFSAAGINVPESVSYQPGVNMPYPFIVKPRFSRGSRGFTLVNCKEDLKKVPTASEFPGGFVAQRFISGKEFTVSVIVDKDGNLLAVVPKEVVLKKGITWIGITKRSNAIDDACRKINKLFNPCGPFNVQLIMDKNGIPYIIEVNPRFSTTVALTIESGIDEVSLLVLDCIGRKISCPNNFKENLVMIRYTEQLFIDESKLLPGGKI